MKRGFLIYCDADYAVNKDFANRFLTKGKDFGLEIELVFEKDIKYGIADGKLYFNYKNLKLPDFAINRTRNGFIAQTLEKSGVKVYNNSEVTFLCNDKNATYIEALKNGANCLDTMILSRENLNYDHIYNYPVVLKQPFSHGEKNVYLCNNRDELEKAFESTEGRFATVQSKLNCEKINDIRVYILGNKPIYAVKRTAKAGFKANYCQGGEISLYDIDSRLKQNIQNLLKINTFDFAGFDFLADDDNNYYFNEIEDAVGSRSLCILTGIDTSELFMDYIRKNIK